jgi:hypothetical protein
MDPREGNLPPPPLTNATKPVFENVYGAQESIPRNLFRQPIQLDGPVRKIGFRTSPPGWKSIPSLLKRSANTGSIPRLPE